MRSTMSLAALHFLTSLDQTIKHMVKSSVDCTFSPGTPSYCKSQVESRIIIKCSVKPGHYCIFLVHPGLVQPPLDHLGDTWWTCGTLTF